MAIEVFNRYESKFLVDDVTYKKIIGIIKEHMVADKYNVKGKPYTITNIYYDTDDNELIRKSIESPIYKEKLRLRSYGVPNLNSKVFLEIKKKYNHIVNKRRTTLTLSEAYDFTKTKIEPEFKDYMNKQVLDEITYFLDLYSLKPKLYLAYDRIAFFEKDNPDLRISFDTNIRSRRENVALEKGDYGTRLLDYGTHLMEIKTSKAMPMWLVDMLSEYNIRRTSFSKYGTEYKNIYKNQYQFKKVI
ncbi:MAG: polyphosphate polymerase domain-containing protein [Lachnospirales bacterium]